MKVDQVRPQVFHLTMHAQELAALIAGARWAAEEGREGLDPEAVEHLRQVLANYDAQISALTAVAED